MVKKRIAIVAEDEKVNIVYKNQLESIFAGEVETELLYLDDDPEMFLGFDLILAASTTIYDDVRKKAPLNARIITIIRNLNTINLHKLFNIEAGSRVLVASKFMYTARETIALINELGLSHIECIPYCPGCVPDISVLSSIDLAVCAGAPEAVPSGIDRVIDLGLKVIDLSTVLDIIINLGLPLEKINLFTLRYMKEFIALNKKISGLKSRLEAVLDASSDGMAALDLDGNILFMNKNLDKYLNAGRQIVVGENISQYIRVPHIIEFIRSTDSGGSDIFKINKKDVMVYKSYLKSGENADSIVISFSNVSEIQDMEKEIRKKLNNKGNVAKYDFSDIIGNSKSIKTATAITRKAAGTDLAVLVLGENGTGKELFAQAVHRNSSRKDGPFVAVNFAALPENLVESELFGYEEGAFTGAKKGGKLGLFELAHNGTIFLDEIGDAPLSLQARLLRVIQEKEILRIGGVSPIPVNVRIIAATNRDLKDLIKLNQFRQDLYYRLNAITIRIPALRERKEDIPQIIDYYMNNFNAKKIFTNEAYRKLIEYDWPGNVRELENLIHYVVEIVDGEMVGVYDLPVDIRGGNYNMVEGEEDGGNIIDLVGSHGNTNLLIVVLKELEQAERLYHKASRSYLIGRLSQQGIPITDNVLRRILNNLKKLGCVDIGSTKQGTRITRKGRETLVKLKFYIHGEMPVYDVGAAEPSKVIVPIGYPNIIPGRRKKRDISEVVNYEDFGNKNRLE